MALTNAQRQKLYNARQRREVTRAVVGAPIFLDYLIRIGAIAAERTADPTALGDAIMEWAGHMMSADLVRNVVTVRAATGPHSRSVTKAIARTGRPPKRPPADAVERVRELSAEGHSHSRHRQQLGVGRKTLDKWRTEFPEIDDAYREGVERERYELHSGLVAKAKAGNIVAAMFC